MVASLTFNEGARARDVCRYWILVLGLGNIQGTEVDVFWMCPGLK